MNDEAVKKDRRYPKSSMEIDETFFIEIKNRATLLNDILNSELFRDDQAPQAQLTEERIMIIEAELQNAFAKGFLFSYKELSKLRKNG